jgi:hypothetical protein
MQKTAEKQQSSDSVPEDKSRRFCLVQTNFLEIMRMEEDITSNSGGMNCDAPRTFCIVWC